MIKEDLSDIKVIDFGIAKQKDNKKKNNSKKFSNRIEMLTDTGIKFYKAPEMFVNSVYDERIDTWAVGVIAY